MVMHLSRRARLDALIIAIATGLLVASETGAIVMGIFLPLESLLGLPASVLPLEVGISVILALYAGYRIARNAYAVEIDLRRHAGSDEEDADT